MIYAHNPAGQWTNQHQMSLNGKRDNFVKTDLTTLADTIGIPRPMSVIN